MRSTNTCITTLIYSNSKKRFLTYFNRTVTNYFWPFHKSERVWYNVCIDILYRIAGCHWVINSKPNSRISFNKQKLGNIIHQAGEGTTRLRLCQLSMCLPPGVAPGAESITYRHYIYMLAQIRPLHCTISSLALRRSATNLIYNV